MFYAGVDFFHLPPHPGAEEKMKRVKGGEKEGKRKTPPCGPAAPPSCVYKKGGKSFLTEGEVEIIHMENIYP